MNIRTITTRGVSDRVLGLLRERARAGRRSLNSEILAVLESAALGRVSEAPVAYGVAAPPVERVMDHVDHDLLAVVCREYHIRSLAVFGSQVSGAVHADSDVDVLVEFAPGMTPGLGFVSVADALRPVFGGRRVDLVTRRGLAPRVRDHILRTAVPLYGA